MKFDVLTLFPEMFAGLNESIIGKAIENNLIEINLINIRDFSKDKHKKVDDTPYGGGCGMVSYAKTGTYHSTGCFKVKGVVEKQLIKYYEKTGVIK